MEEDVKRYDEEGNTDPDGPLALEWERQQDQLWEQYLLKKLDAEEFTGASLGLGPQPQDWATCSQ